LKRCEGKGGPCLAVPIKKEKRFLPVKTKRKVGGKGYFPLEGKKKGSHFSRGTSALGDGGKGRVKEMNVVFFARREKGEKRKKKPSLGTAREGGSAVIFTYQ